MPSDRPVLPVADLERIYSTSIRPDALEGIAKSKSPTAVLVAGAPGADAAYALARVRRNLEPVVGASALIRAADLSAYHPHWREQSANEPLPRAAVRVDVERWRSRLFADAANDGLNVVVEADDLDPTLTALAAGLRAQGYQVAGVVLAADLETLRQMAVARWILGRSFGTPAALPLAEHEPRHEALRAAIARLESELSVDRLQVVTSDGRQLYANALGSGRWVSEPRAAYVLDDMQQRRATARELADTALRWQVLVEQLGAQPAAPGDLLTVACRWRDEATMRAQADPDAARLLACGREAQAFRSMDRVAFARAYPQHAKLVERLQEAIDYAEQQFEHAADRRRFIEQARQRLADRIAEGRAPAPEAVKARPARGPRTR
jgi:hypothetical protein